MWERFAGHSLQWQNVCMKALWTATLALAFLCCFRLGAQTPKESDISTRPLSQDRLAIYRDFLSHYGKYEQQLSNLLGMQPTTVPFVIDTLGGSDRSVYGPNGCLHNVKMEPQSDLVHRLPPEIMQFSDPDSVSRRIARAGKPHPRYAKGTGADGWVLTKFTLSEIFFDVTHRYAVFNFSANCDCLGGQGGTILYELKGSKWQRSRVCDAWEG